MRVYPTGDWPFKVVEEATVTAALVAAEQQWPRFPEIWDGIIWMIAHGGDKIGGPERRFGTGGHFTYTYEGDSVAGFPRIVVVYRWGLGSWTIRMIVVSAPTP